MNGRIYTFLASALMLSLCGATAMAQEALQFPDYHAGMYGGSQTQLVSHTTATATNASLLSRVEALEAALKEQEMVTSGDCDPQDWEEVKQGWSHKLEGRALFDYTMFTNQSAGNLAQYGDQQNGVELRDVRIGVKGDGYGIYDYRVVVQYTPGDDEIAMKYAYFGFNQLPYVDRAIIGLNKPLQGLEHLTSKRFITFMERSAPTEVFSWGRRWGLFTNTETLGDSLVIQGNLVFATPELEKQLIYEDDNQGVGAGTRVVWTPWYQVDGRHMLHLGFNWHYADHAGNTMKLRTRPETHVGDRIVYVEAQNLDNSHVISTETMARYGPLSLQSELFYGDYKMAAGDAAAYGAYATVSYFLTGEHRGYKRSAAKNDRVKPITNFWLVDTSCGGCDAGWGAWELAMRWSYLDLTDDNFTIPAPASHGFGGIYNGLTFGVNWYWNPHIRMMLNYTHAFPTTRQQGADYVASDMDILGLRWQYDF